MVAKLSAMTSRSAAGMIESIMVDLYRDGDAERGAWITAARFRRHVAMAMDGVVCIGVAVAVAPPLGAVGHRGRVRPASSYASTCGCDLSVMLRPRLLPPAAAWPLIGRHGVARRSATPRCGW